MKAEPEHVMSGWSPSRAIFNNQRNDMESGSIMFVNAVNKEVARWRAEMECEELNS